VLALGNQTLMDRTGEHRDAVPGDLVAEVLTGDADGTRTKAALAECNAIGIRLGNPRLAEINRTRKQQARQFANQHSNLSQSLRNKCRTLREICDVLNVAGMKTAQGSMFHPVQVHRILRRSN